MPPRRLRLEDNAYLSRSGCGLANSSTSAELRLYGNLSAVVSRSWLALSIALILALAGCGGGNAHSAAPAAKTVAAAFKDSPPPLAALHGRANQLASGGPAAFKALLTGLRGYPVVVNKWASWCVPCQSEFPAFQKAAVAFGRQVAFVGLNGKDEKASAAAFLRKFPVTYPSYVDPHEDIARTIEASTYYPLTVYFDRKGRIQFVHAGSYTSASTLERDIRRYALGSS
jgi:cytochrome c biogenesis protein CcmG, thiol:disulfide interchange protein DsbE